MGFYQFDSLSRRIGVVDRDDDVTLIKLTLRIQVWRQGDSRHEVRTFRPPFPQRRCYLRRGRSQTLTQRTSLPSLRRNRACWQAEPNLQHNTLARNKSGDLRHLMPTV